MKLAKNGPEIIINQVAYLLCVKQRAYGADCDNG